MQNQKLNKALPLIPVILALIGVSCSTNSTTPTSIVTSTIIRLDDRPIETAHVEPPEEVVETVANLPQEPDIHTFDSDRAMQDIDHQLQLGPRIPGSKAHEATRSYILENLSASGWSADSQTIDTDHAEIINLVGKKGKGKPWVILGAHYDSRIFADRDSDPHKRDQPVPGANDGASGVAVLLELARTLPADLPFEIWLVFFDAEDNGNIPGWEWIMGSTAFANQLQEKPDKVVIVDMIGDANLNILIEQYSTPELVTEIWQVAESLNYSNYFINTNGQAILDDHIPFLNAGIPAVDIIDIDYTYWHTTEDTPDKVSPHSLEIVGNTLYIWLVNLK